VSIAPSVLHAGRSIVVLPENPEIKLGVVDDLVGVDVKALFDELEEMFSESAERRLFMEDSQKLSNHDLVLLQSVLSRKVSREEMLQRIESIDEPARVIRTIWNLTTELLETDNRLLLELIFKFLEQPAVYNELDPDGDAYFGSIVLSNPNLTGEQINLLWQRYRTAWLRMDEPYYIQEIVTNPECPVTILEELLDYDDRLVKSAIARNKNISPKIVHIYLNSPRKPDRKALAGNMHVRAEVLMSLMGDRYEDIIKSAKRNYLKRFPADSLSDEAIAAAIAKNIDKAHAKTRKPKKAKEVFDPYEAERLGAEYVVSLRDPKDRKKVAESTFDAEIFDSLARDSSVIVRRVVASRHQCLETLRSLIEDKDLQTSNNAFKNLASRQDDYAAEELLTRSSLDAAYAYINHHVNEDSEEFVLEKELKSKERAEFGRAKLTAGFTNNEIIQNRILQGLADSPALFSIRRAFVSALADNPHLGRAATRKFVLELGFSVWRVLENCRDPELLNELIADDRLPQSSREVAVRARDKLLNKL